jgi:hypothetical protein
MTCASIQTVNHTKLTWTERTCVAIDTGHVDATWRIQTIIVLSTIVTRVIGRTGALKSIQNIGACRTMETWIGGTIINQILTVGSTVTISTPACILIQQVGALTAILTGL